MPPDLSQMTTEELLAGYKAAQAREAGPPVGPAPQQDPLDHAKAEFAKPIGDQAKDVWSEMWRRHPNVTGDEMGSAALFFPKGAGLLSQAAPEAAEAAPIIERFSRGATETAAPVAAGAAESGGLLSRAGGFLKSKLGSVGGGVLAAEAVKEGGKALWEKKGEIADKAITLGAGLLNEDTASNLSHWATNANPNDLEQKTNDELIRGYQEALARERGAVK